MAEKAVAVKKNSGQVSSVDTFISQALAANAPIETLERLFALHKDVKAEQAWAAFTQASADFQKNCPIIEKTKKVMNKDGRSVRYVYAPIDAIAKQIQKPVSEAQLSYRFDVLQEEKSKGDLLCDARTRAH